MSGFNPMQLMNMIGGMGGGNAMANNPMMSMVMQMMNSGGNPQQMLMQMAQQNPQLKQMLPLIQGKSPQQLQSTFENLCKEKGIDPNQIKQQFEQQMQNK